MSYAMIVAEVRRGVFEERNLDAIGLAALLQKDIVLLIPDNTYEMNQNPSPPFPRTESLQDRDKGGLGGFSGEKLADTILKVKTEETVFLNPLNMVNILEKVMGTHGKPDVIILPHSSAGIDLAPYIAGYFNLPLITDVSSFDKDKGIFYKSYYSDKIFGEFRLAGEGPYVITVRSGSFKEYTVEKGSSPTIEAIENIPVSEGRSFIEYVEEEKTEIDITKAEFLLSVGRGIGSKDEIADYGELAGLLKAVLSGSRPVIDKMWLPKARQVGTSGKTVKPRVYLAMAISGAFQHIAGMKDSDCIIAVNKDPEAPIFQYAHFGVIGDANKLRDKLKEIVKG